MRLQNTSSSDGADEIFMNLAQGGNTEANAAAQNRPATQYEDPLDDVFGSAPSSPVLEHAATGTTESRQRNALTDPSDIPRLRSTHVTNGYRDGIAASKEQHVQAGFDEGYSLGAELGMRIGWILGAIEGMLHAAPALVDTVSEESSGQSASGAVDAVTKARVRAMLLQAEEEVKAGKLFHEQYFGSDGVWLYTVPGAENEGQEEITFKEVAAAHPVVAEWTSKVEELARGLGLVLTRG